MADVRPPIILDYRGDVQLFEGIREAERYVEPVDVQNREFTAFDCRGLVLVPIVDEDRTHVHLEPSRPTEYRADELVTVLRRFLSHDSQRLVGVAEDEVWRMGLEAMIAALKRAQTR